MFNRDAMLYWPNGAPVPFGWRFVCKLEKHHGHYSCVIARTWLGALLNPWPHEPLLPGEWFKIGKQEPAE